MEDRAARSDINIPNRTNHNRAYSDQARPEVPIRTDESINVTRAQLDPPHAVVLLVGNVEKPAGIVRQRSVVHSWNIDLSKNRGIAISGKPGNSGSADRI